MSDSNKKLLIVAPYFYPNIEWGGPVTVSLNHAVALKNAGYTVTVLTTNASNRENKLENIPSDINGVRIIYAKGILPKTAWSLRIFLSFDQIIKGWKLIPEFDMVHFHDCFIIQNIVLSIRCRLLRIPYVITPHGSLSFAKERSKSVLKRVFTNLLMGKYLEGSSKIITVSESEKKDIDLNFPKLKNKTICVPNIIKAESFAKIDIRSRLHIPEGDLILLCLSRLYQLKGVAELTLGFLKFLEKYNKNATLIFAGPDAGAVNEIKRLLSETRFRNKVIFTGEVVGEIKSNIIYNVDIVCLLSKSESMPTVLLEAASFAKPVICTKECNMDSLINYGGAILTTRKAEDIATSINKLTKNETRLSIGKKAKDWFDKNYNTTKIVNKYKDIYKNAK